MPRQDALHWLAEPGEDWNLIVSTTGCSKAALAKANRALGYVYTTSFNKQPQAGDVLHIPLGVIR